MIYLASLCIDDVYNYLNWLWIHRLQPDGSNLLGVGSNINNGFNSPSTQNQPGDAILETGMDNTPMYNNAIYNSVTYMLESYDLGQSSLFVSECQALIEIIINLGASMLPLSSRYVATLNARSSLVVTAIQNNLYHQGIYQNYYIIDPPQWEPTELSPTSFYPMIAGIASVEQAENMIVQYLMNTSWFCLQGMNCDSSTMYTVPTIAIPSVDYDIQFYWQGRVWGPTNLVMYWSLTTSPIYSSSSIIQEAVQYLIYMSIFYGVKNISFMVMFMRIIMLKQDMDVIRAIRIHGILSVLSCLI